jgi:hypothetical protein
MNNCYHVILTLSLIGVFVQSREAVCEDNVIDVLLETGVEIHFAPPDSRAKENVRWLQGNRVLILGKTGQELFKGAFAPAAPLAFAAETSL